MVPAGDHDQGKESAHDEPRISLRPVDPCNVTIHDQPSEALCVGL